MLEFMLTLLVIFASPLPLWLVLLHLCAKNNAVYTKVVYYLNVVFWLAIAYFAFSFPDLIFKHQFTANYVTFFLGIIFLVFAIIIDYQVMTHLGWKRLICKTELDNKASNQLVTSGIYKYARHPRYAEYPLWSLSLGLFFGYAFFLWFSLYLFLGFYIVSYFEEAELVNRFGKAYELYQKKVPRFFIRFGK